VARCRATSGAHVSSILLFAIEPPRAGNAASAFSLDSLGTYHTNPGTSSDPLAPHTHHYRLHAVSVFLAIPEICSKLLGQPISAIRGVEASEWMAPRACCKSLRGLQERRNAATASVTKQREEAQLPARRGVDCPRGVLGGAFLETSAGRGRYHGACQRGRLGVVLRASELAAAMPARCFTRSTVTIAD
jgi:hypothetical protein